MKKLMIVACALVAGSAFSAQYRLKANVTAELLDKAGKPIEQKTLKVGTLVTVEEDEVQAAKKATRLTPSKLTLAEFKTSKPSAGAVFRVHLELKQTATYYGIFEGKEKSVLQYDVTVIDKDGTRIGYLTAYVTKNSKIGKILRAKVEEGKSPIAYAKMRIIKQMSEEDVYIDDVEFL